MQRFKAISKRILVIAAAAGLLAMFVLVRAKDLSDGGKRTVIQVWHPWGGSILESFQESIDRFEQATPTIACKTLYVANDLSNSQKFYTAVVGDCAPEVMFVDGPQVAEWAERGLLTDLGPLLEKRGINLAELEQGFFDPCWKQCVYRGKIWAITYCADPNFALFWNKKTFRDAIAAGEIPPDVAAKIDLDAGPRTIDEVDHWNDAISVKQPDGRVTRIGMIPWAVYGEANSLFTWGWVFGGSFYDAENFKVTPDDPRIVAALEWMCTYAKKYDARKLQDFSSTFQSELRDRFFIGQQAIEAYHLSGVANIDKFRPDWKFGQEFGVGFLPTGPGGEPHTAWVGGWTMAIPSTVTDPKQVEAALDYILWSCISDEGTSMAARAREIMPAWKKAPFFAEVSADPRMEIYVKILQTAQHQRPVMPVQGFYMQELARAVQNAVDGVKTSKEALEYARDRTQRELDRVLDRRGGRP